jgi:hypothetical protein
MADPNQAESFNLDSALKELSQVVTDASNKLVGSGQSLISSFTGLSSYLKTTVQQPGITGALGTLTSDLVALQATSEAQVKLTDVFDAAMAPLRVGVKAIVNDYAKDTAEVANVLMDFSGLSADAIMRAEFGIDSVTRKAAVSSFDMIKNIEQTQVTLLDGTTRYLASYAKPVEIAKNFSDAVLDDSRIYLAASEGMNEKMLLSVTEAKDRLGMASGEINEIMQRELSATGKVTGEFLEKQMKTILAAAEVAGVNIPKLRHDMVTMYADMDHYGMLTEEQMVSLSNTVQHLGLDISDVTRLADKFSSFDSAIQTVNQLTAATGATLDTMKLFELANESPEEFVNELRAQLDAAGVEFDDLNQIQKRALAQTFGIDQGLLQRLTNDNIEAVESIAEETGAAAEAMSTEEMNRRLLSMKKIEADSMTNFTKNMASIEQLSIGTAVSIEKATSILAAKTTEFFDSAFGKINGQVNLLSQKAATLRADIDKLAGVLSPSYIPPSIKISPPGTVTPPPPVIPSSPAATTPTAASTAATSGAAAPTATPPPVPTPAPAPPPAPAPAASVPVEIVLKVRTDSNLDFLKFEHAEKSFVYDGKSYNLVVSR